VGSSLSKTTKTGKFFGLNVKIQFLQADWLTDQFDPLADWFSVHFRFKTNHLYELPSDFFGFIVFKILKM
jgi:hypothetical protein